MPSPLPGTTAAYLVRSGDGERYAFAGQLAALIARPEDTGNLLEAAIVSGGRGARFPRHEHARGHEAVLVLDGRLDLTLGSAHHTLERGDYASIPPATPHGYEMRGRYTRLLQWTVGGAASALYTAIGRRTEALAHDAGTAVPPDTARLTAGSAEADVSLAHTSGSPAPGTSMDRSPGDATAYVLESGDGERLLAGDQLFTFLSDRRDTQGRFITLSTLGPAGDRIPNHFHEKHTETFFCLEGRMTMWAGGEEMAILPGDFLHVPAGTIHSYRLDAPYTRFVGLLSPGLFEPFFRAMCEPYEGYIFPAVPGPVRFDRVMQQLHELDLKLVDPPRPPARP